MLCSWIGNGSSLVCSTRSWFLTCFGLSRSDGAPQNAGTVASRLDTMLSALDGHLGHNKVCVCVCQWSYQTLLNCLCLVTNWIFTHGYSDMLLANLMPVQNRANLEGLELSEMENPKRGVDPDFFKDSQSTKRRSWTLTSQHGLIQHSALTQTEQCNTCRRPSFSPSLCAFCIYCTKELF